MVFMGLQNTSIAVFLHMVVEKDYQTELRDMVQKKFPISETFTENQQRLYVIKARGAYRVAMETVKVLKKEEDDCKKKMEIAQAPDGDVERELDPKTKSDLKQTWDGSHSWQLDRSMRGAPALRNRAYREFHCLCMTLHTVETAIAVDDIKRAP